MFLRIALALALIAGLAAAVQTWRVSQALHRAEAAEMDAEHWLREATTARERLAQARDAYRVAETARRQAEAQAAEYDALRRTLTEGASDEPLPDWFRSYLGRLLRTVDPDGDAGRPADRP